MIHSRRPSTELLTLPCFNWSNWSCDQVGRGLTIMLVSASLAVSPPLATRPGTRGVPHSWHLLMLLGPGAIMAIWTDSLAAW